MVANNLSPTATSPTNVLVARFSALGDVCMAIPVVYGVCRANPDVRVVFVTKPAVTGLFINPPENLVVVGADVKHQYSGITGLRRLFPSSAKNTTLMLLPTFMMYCAHA